MCLPALIISIYSSSICDFSCPDSLYSSAVSRQSGNPGPLLASQHPSSQLCRVRVFRYQGWPVLWYPVTASVAVDLQVALSTTFFSLLTYYVKLHAPSTYQLDYSYNVFDIFIWLFWTEKINITYKLHGGSRHLGVNYICKFCSIGVSYLIVSQLRVTHLGPPFMGSLYYSL